MRSSIGYLFARFPIGETARVSHEYVEALIERPGPAAEVYHEFVEAIINRPGPSSSVYHHFAEGLISNSRFISTSLVENVIVAFSGVTQISRSNLTSSVVSRYPIEYVINSASLIQTPVSVSPSETVSTIAASAITESVTQDTQVPSGSTVSETLSGIVSTLTDSTPTVRLT
jgi:hypothetical protein